MNDTKSWMELAVSSERPELVTPHGCAASDGNRMHIENDTDACKCGNETRHKGFDRVIEMVKDTPLCFVVNRQYLMDALLGINPDGRVILFFVEPGSKSPIVIQDPHGERTAIIMPMAGLDDVTKPQNLPHVTPKKKPSRYKINAEES